MSGIAIGQRIRVVMDGRIYQGQYGTVLALDEEHVVVRMDGCGLAIRFRRCEVVGAT